MHSISPTLLNRIWYTVLGALTLWAFVIEPGFTHHSKDYEIKIEHWKDEDYKIAVLADLHVGSPLNGLKKLVDLVEMTNRREPDLILIAGDFVIHEVIGGSFVAPETIAPVLANLKAKDGVYAVLGNHDYWHNGFEVTQALERVGIPVLTNKALEKENYWLVGVDDKWAGRPSIQEALEQITSDKPIIAFTHNPDLFPEIPHIVDLTIAGHTHGGQVYVPLIGRPIVPSDYGERFAIGHIVEDGKQLFVNPGTGTSILPVRFLVPPEISVIRLISKK